MTTATSTPSGNLTRADLLTGNADPNFMMEERKEPTFVKFEPGETVEGVLMSIQTVEVGEKKQRATKYTVMDIDTKELSAFLGTYMIDTKIRQSDKGHYVMVVCEGTDPNVTRNGNPMKLFTVRVSNKPVSALTGNQVADGTFITDADIPF